MAIKVFIDTMYQAYNIPTLIFKIYYGYFDENITPNIVRRNCYRDFFHQYWRVLIEISR